jgi:hypothetical protein
MNRNFASRFSMVCFGFSISFSVGDFASASGEESPEDKEIVIDENTFGCISDMHRVNQMYVGNLLGDPQKTIEVAEKGGIFPVGSALRLIPDEIMVKGHPGSRPSTGDWMFVRLDYNKEDGSQKVTTGFEEVTNFLNLTCFFLPRGEWI